MSVTFYTTNHFWHHYLFYRPRSHPHHRSEELALSRPERLEPRQRLLRDTERPYAGGTPCPTAPELGPCAQTCPSAVEPVPFPQPQPYRSAPLAEAATQHKRAKQQRPHSHVDRLSVRFLEIR